MNTGANSVVAQGLAKIFIVSRYFQIFCCRIHHSRQAYRRVDQKSFCFVVTILELQLQEVIDQSNRKLYIVNKIGHAQTKSLRHHSCIGFGYRV